MNDQRRFYRGIILISMAIVCGLLGIVFTLANAAAGVDGWIQSGESGFGTIMNQNISALEVFEGDLYAGTWNEEGAQVWTSSGGLSWEEQIPGLSNEVAGLDDLHPFDNQLYAGFVNNVQGGEIWRTDGITWTQVVARGFGDFRNFGVIAFNELRGELVAATGNYSKGVEIWSSSTGDRGSWEKVNESGFGQEGDTGNVVMHTYDDVLYVGFGRRPGYAELWRTDDLVQWTSVFTDGLGNPANSAVTAMAEFDGEFYIALRNIVTGAEVWRSNDGETWTKIVDQGLGKPQNKRPYGLIEYNRQLYLVISNLTEGGEVWRSGDGENWELIMNAGFGDPANGFLDYFDRAAAVYNTTLYIGTLNEETGGQVWFMELQKYLPMLWR